MPVARGYLDFPEALPRTRDELVNGMPSEWYSHLIVDTGTEFREKHFDDKKAYVEVPK